MHSDADCESLTLYLGRVIRVCVSRHRAARFDRSRVRSWLKRLAIALFAKHREAIEVVSPVEVVCADGRELARRLLAAKDLDATWSRLDGPQALERLLVEFGGQVTNVVGDEVDRIEEELSEAVPDARHIDLEAD